MSTQRIEHLLQALQTRPKDPFVLYALGIEHASSGEDQKARAYFEQALDCDASYVPAYFHLGLCLRRLGEKDKSRETLTRGLSEAKNKGDTHSASEIQGALNESEEGTTTCE